MDVGIWLDPQLMLYSERGNLSGALGYGARASQLWVSRPLMEAKVVEAAQPPPCPTLISDNATCSTLIMCKEFRAQ